MRLFFRIVRLSFQQQLTYRAATLSGLATNFFFALLRVAVILALYGNQPQVAQWNLARLAETAARLWRVKIGLAPHPLSYAREAASIAGLRVGNSAGLPVVTRLTFTVTVGGVIDSM